MPNQWVIPDIHGYHLTLKELIDGQIKPSLDDELYFLGDYIDRGPDSKGVLDYLMSLEERGLRVRFLLGNHESYLIETHIEDKDKPSFIGFRSKGAKEIEWLKYGCKETLKSFGVNRPGKIPDKYINSLKKAEYYITLDKFILVHAGLNFNQPDPFSDTHFMLWAREFTPDLERTGGRIVIHGHIPVEHEFIDYCANQGEFGFLALDNGVYLRNKTGFGNLMAFEINKSILLAQPPVDEER